MTFKEYIEALSNTGFFGKNKARIGIMLFDASTTADPKVIPSESTIKKWFSADRNCSIERYFPNGKMDESGFIKYIRNRTKDRDALKKLQEVFRSMEPTDSMTEDFRIDLQTEDAEVFYWSLLNQFQRIFRLPESEQKADGSATPVVVTPQKKLSSEQVRDWFLDTARHFKIMEIINRKPAVFDRNDSASFNVFLRQVDIFIMNRNAYKVSLYALIRSFIDALSIQVLTIDAILNNRFDFEDETASVSMEDTEELEDDDENLNPWDLPELTPELIEAAEEPIPLLRLAVSEWGNFRNEMNVLFKEIESWNDEKSEHTS